MRNGYRIVDTDCHQIEPARIWKEFIDPRFADRAPVVGDYGNGSRGLVVEGEPVTRQVGSYPMDSPEFHAANARAMQRFARLREAGFGGSARVADMDEQGVDVQVLYPTFGGQILGRPFVDVELLAAVCRAYNDWSFDYASVAPARLRIATMLPLQSVDLAIEEARRTAALGAVGFYVRPNPVVGRNLHHADYEPLWRTIAELGLPVCLHDSGSPYLPSFGERMETHTSGHIVAHPFEAMVAMMGLIWFGVVERHPTLKIVHVEADAGWLPYWLQRMEQHYAFSGNAEHPDLKRSPTSYFKSNFLVACRGDEHTLPAAVDLVGDAYLTFNTDYPHADGTYPWGMDALERQPIGTESIRRIYWDNAARVFPITA